MIYSYIQLLFIILSILKNLYISKLARVFDGSKRIENLENPDPKMKLVILFKNVSKIKKVALCSTKIFKNAIKS